MSRCVNNRYGASQDTAGGVSIQGGKYRISCGKGVSQVVICPAAVRGTATERNLDYRCFATLVTIWTGDLGCVVFCLAASAWKGAEIGSDDKRKL